MIIPHSFRLQTPQKWIQQKLNKITYLMAQIRKVMSIQFMMGIMHCCHLTCGANFLSVVMNNRQEGEYLLIQTVSCLSLWNLCVGYTYDKLTIMVGELWSDQHFYSLIHHCSFVLKWCCFYQNLILLYFLLLSIDMHNSNASYFSLRHSWYFTFLILSLVITVSQCTNVYFQSHSTFNTDSIALTCGVFRFVVYVWWISLLPQTCEVQTLNLNYWHYMI